MKYLKTYEQNSNIVEDIINKILSGKLIMSKPSYLGYNIRSSKQDREYYDLMPYGPPDNIVWYIAYYPDPDSSLETIKISPEELKEFDYIYELSPEEKQELYTAKKYNL